MKESIEDLNIQEINQILNEVLNNVTRTTIVFLQKDWIDKDYSYMNIYKITTLKNGFIKCHHTVDSYGNDNDSTDRIQFVKGKEKTVTIYEFE